MSLIQIQSIRDRIPSFDCIPGCTDCCGPTFFSKSEWDAVPEHRQLTSLTCPYAREGHGCDIYEHRPVLCRLFGAVDDDHMRCPHGKGPNVMLTKWQGRTILRKWKQVMREEVSQ